MPQTVNQSVQTTLLTGFSRAFKSPILSWYKIFPRLKVEDVKGMYEVADFSEARLVNDGFADGDATAKTDFGWVYANYQVENHGLRHPFTRQQREHDKRYEQRKMRAAKGLIQQVQNITERKVVNIMTASANNVATASNLDLSNVASSALYPALSLAMNTVRNATGVFPNTIAMNTSALMRISQLAEYRDNSKYVVDLNAAGLPASMMNGKLEVVEFISAFDTAAKGLARSLSSAFGNFIWLGYVDRDSQMQGEVLTYGATIFTDEYSREFYDDVTESNWLEYKFIHTPVPVAKECGYLIPITL